LNNKNAVFQKRAIFLIVKRFKNKILYFCNQLNIHSMKILKAIVVLFALFFVGLIIESCRCPQTYSYEYSLSSFEIYPLDNEAILSLMGSAAGGGDENPLVFRKDFGAEIEFKTNIKLLANQKHVGSFFIQTTYAFSCPEDTYEPREHIVSLQVFSDRDFGETHPAGANIAEFFKVSEWNWYYEGKESLFPGLTSFEDYFQRPAPTFNAPPDYRINCLITETELEAGEYEFRFVVTLSDGRILENSIIAVLE
jgi:hypothetical protein